jgi:quercetin dioxygenase-like cupin family protein
MRLRATTIIALLLAVAPWQVRAVEPMESNSGSSRGGKEEMQGVQITRSGAQPSQHGPGEHFTGSVRVDPLFQPNAPSRTSGAYVTFEPCARSAWHTHPLGQILVITSGVGRVQQWGGPVQEIRAGDVVWTAPGVKHWHGASPTIAMTHLAIQEALDGKAVEWMEKVTDEQYGK